MTPEESRLQQEVSQLTAKAAGERCARLDVTAKLLDDLHTAKKNAMTAEFALKNTIEILADSCNCKELERLSRFSDKKIISSLHAEIAKLKEERDDFKQSYLDVCQRANDANALNDKFCEQASMPSKYSTSDANVKKRADGMISRGYDVIGYVLQEKSNSSNLVVVTGSHSDPIDSEDFNRYLTNGRNYNDTILALENKHKDFIEADRLATLRAQSLLSVTTEKIVLEGKLANLLHNMRTLKSERDAAQVELNEALAKLSEMEN